jgi:hypothetical protein
MKRRESHLSAYNIAHNQENGEKPNQLVGTWRNPTLQGWLLSWKGKELGDTFKLTLEVVPFISYAPMTFQRVKTLTPSIHGVLLSASNIKGENTMTTVLLFKKDTSRSFMGLPWWVSTYKGETIASKGFRTAKEARLYAKSKKWSVHRSPGCDDYHA